MPSRAMMRFTRSSSGAVTAKVQSQKSTSWLSKRPMASMPTAVAPAAFAASMRRWVSRAMYLWVIRFRSARAFSS